MFYSRRREHIDEAYRHQNFLARMARKDRKLGPYMCCSLERRDERLVIPMPGWNKEIWLWWRNHGATWNGGSFEYDVKGLSNQLEWIHRASERFFELWRQSG